MSLLDGYKVGLEERIIHYSFELLMKVAGSTSLGAGFARQPPRTWDDIQPGCTHTTPLVFHVPSPESLRGFVTYKMKGLDRDLLYYCR